MRKKIRKFPVTIRIKNKYPLMVASAFFIYIFFFVFMIIFAAQVGPSLMVQQAGVTAVPNVTRLSYGKDYTTVDIDNAKVNQGTLILVNNEHPCKINGVNLVSLLKHSNNTYQVADYEVMINSAIVDNVNNMLGDFHAVHGENETLINCCYRSKELQQKLYEEEIKNNSGGGINADGTYKNDLVAKSGYSEHQTGYSLDFSLMNSEGILSEFTGEGKYSWIQENSAKYGFIMRYAADKTEYTGYAQETWHFRYIGQPHAAYLVQNNLCLEEYINLLKTYTVKDPLTITDLSLQNWQIYYVPAQAGEKTEIPIPKKNDYQISGNNVDGFIVSIAQS